MSVPYLPPARQVIIILTCIECQQPMYDCWCAEVGLYDTETLRDWCA